VRDYPDDLLAAAGVDLSRRKVRGRKEAEDRWVLARREVILRELQRRKVSLA
jgi:hypothetical protein